MKLQLPIDAAIPSLLETLREKNCLVLSATPGAGKTTRLPPELLKITDGMVVVLEPRRIAAISAAQRIAEENGWELGREVGYQVRFESNYSRETRLLFLTEALLLRKLLRDPDLRGVGCVVLDEFHERSIHVDLALGALKELQALARPDLKLVVMSATLNSEPLSRFLDGAHTALVPGKIFPMEIRYETKGQLLRTGPEFTERLMKLVVKAAGENREGDILCFLPGRGEIERLKTALAPWAAGQGIALFALHGQLNLQEQRSTLTPLPGRRKIILATNVAESSLTVGGVNVVVDSGLARISQVHPRTGFESLDLVRISKASATQRAGRSARNGPGVVYRAWMAYDELSMKDFEHAELQRTDLAETLLLLAALGIRKPENFTWFEPPPARSLEQAQAFLSALGALKPDGSLTPLGERLRAFPLHPRLAKLLLVGQERGIGEFACELAALLSEPGGRNSGGRLDAENDLWLKWEDWRRQPRSPAIARAAAQLKTLIRADSGPARNSLEKEMPALLLATYPDRLCRRRKAHEPQAKMAGGRGVKLHPESSVRASEYFVAVEVTEGREIAETLVFQAVGISPDLVESTLPTQPAKKLEWDETKQRFYVVETKEWNGLSIGREHRRPAEPAETEGQLATVVFARFDRLLAENEELGLWFSRLRFLEKMNEKWPVPSPAQIKEALDMAAYGENSLEAVARKKLVAFFENALLDEHRAALERECPGSWQVPSGSRVKIQYSTEQGAKVEVRLQELFGLTSQPRVAGQPLTLVLLAPNYRPVQVTRDLLSFWQNAYPEVRKEMRSRYPKHSWPDDPLTALPQAKGRPRNTGGTSGPGI